MLETLGRARGERERAGNPGGCAFKGVVQCLCITSEGRVPGKGLALRLTGLLNKKVIEQGYSLVRIGL